MVKDKVVTAEGAKDELLEPIVVVLAECISNSIFIELPNGDS